MRRITSLISLILMMTFSNLQAQELAPGTDIVGYGYDIFGEYANQKSKKRYCLFKYGNNQERVITSKTYMVPENVIVENISEHIVKTVSGESMREYAKSLSGKAGLSIDAFVFSGSVESSFSQSSSGMQKKYYFTYMDANTKWRISLDIRGDYIEPLKKMLDERFVNDLENMPPETLFETYGTHYIASAYLGGRADYKTVTVVTSSTNTQELSTAIEAKYKAVTANASMSQSQKQTFSNSKTNTKLTVVGGNSEYANNISDPATYAKWADGIAAAPVLCDFEEGSLRPIWEFASPERQNELKAAFNKLLQKNPLPQQMANLGFLKENAYMVQCKAGGQYWDFDGYNMKAKKYSKLKLAPKDSKFGDKQGFDRIIKLIPNQEDPEYVRVQPQHFATYLNLSKSKDYINLMPQEEIVPGRQFKFEPVDGEKGYYYIKNRETGKYLEAPKGKENEKDVVVALNEFTGSDNQKWKLVDFNPKDIAFPESAYYAVKTFASNKYWDFPGKFPDVTGTKLQSYSMGKQEGDRVFKFARIDGTDEFVIRPGHETSRVLTARKKGEQLFVFDQHRSDNQLFTFEYGGQPKAYKIKHKGTGKYIHLRSDRTNMNSAEIKLWDNQNADYQNWELIFHKYK